MPSPRFITSDAQIGAPGVYVLERAPASPLRGQKRRTVLFVGQTLKGPTGRVLTFTSWQRFIDVCGSRDRNTNGGAVLNHVWLRMQGKAWGKFKVIRTAAAGAVAASFTLESAAGGGGVAIARVDASSVGAWGNDVGVSVATASDADATHWDLLIKDVYGKVIRVRNINTQVGQNNIAQVYPADDGNLVTITKLADGRPVTNAATVDGADANGYVKLGQVVAAFVSVVGTDGAIADADYTGAGKAMELANGERGADAIAVVGRSNAAIRAKAESLANAASQRVWYVCPDDETITQAVFITERDTRTSKRLCMVFNHELVWDPIALQNVYIEPFVLIMSILSQTDPDIHPGDMDNRVYSAQSRGVAWNLDDPSRDALDGDQVTFIWQDQDQDGNPVIIPGNALLITKTINDQDLDGRYMKDFLLASIAFLLQASQFKGNTPEARSERKSTVSAFLEGLARKRRYIQMSDNKIPLFTYTNGGTVNNTDDQAAGLQVDQLVAKLIPKNKVIKLGAEIGVDAQVDESQASA